MIILNISYFYRIHYFSISFAFWTHFSFLNLLFLFQFCKIFSIKKNCNNCDLVLKIKQNDIEFVFIIVLPFLSLYFLFFPFIVFSLSLFPLLFYFLFFFVGSSPMQFEKEECPHFMIILNISYSLYDYLKYILFPLWLS